MQKNIEEIAKSVLAELESRRYAQTTMLNFCHCANVLVKWVKKEHGGEFSDKAYDSYLGRIQYLLEAGKTNRPYYNIKKRVLNQFRAYFKTGSIDVPYAFDMIQFKPSALAMDSIEAALTASSLTNDGKYKVAGLMRKFFCYVEAEEMGVHDITREVMVDFIDYCREDNAGSMDYVIRMLRTLSDYLVTIDAMPVKPDFGFIVPKHAPSKLIPTFSEQELAKVLAAFDTATPKGNRDYAALLLAVGTGLRAGDIVRLELSDIKWRTQEISIFQSKTDRPLKIPVSGQICNAIADYVLNSRPKSDCKNVFLRVRVPYVALRGSALTKVLDRTCAMVGVEKKAWRAFHSLRRTYGTWLAGESIQITTISQMLGHSEINASKPYLSFDDIQLSECAMGFEDIPLKGGVYGGLQRAYDQAL